MTAPTGAARRPVPASPPPRGRIGLGAGLALAMVVATFTIPALGVVSSVMIEDLGLSRTGFGWIATTIAGTTALAALVTGRATDALGGRTVLLLLMLGTAAGTAVLGLAPNLVVLYLGAALVGLTGAAGNPATNRVIVDHVPAGRRGGIMGVKQSGVQAGIFLAGVALPPVAVAWGWRAAILSLAVSSLVVAALCAWLLPADPHRDGARAATGAYRHPTHVRWLAAYALLMGAGSSSMMSYLPLYAQERLDFSPAAGGAAVSVIGLLGIASRILVARQSEQLDRFSLPLALMAWGAVGAVAALLAAAFTTPALVWPGAVVAGCTVVAWNALANLSAVAAVAPHEAGRASGLVNLGFMTGFTVSPVLFGTLVDLAGYTPAWILLGSCYTAAAVLMHAWSRSTRPA